MKPGSKAWKNFMAKLYGLGAAVVIVGAMFKIQHWPGAGPMLVVGLSTEAVIFFFSAFEKPHEDPDWSLVYPELNASEEEKEELKNVGSKKSMTQELDKMLDDARIEPELMARLGDGLRSLSDNANRLTDISSASVATNEYVQSLKGASHKVSELSEEYQKASETLVGLSASSDASKSAGDGLHRLTSNLNKLNEAYEIQLQGATDNLRASNDAFASIGELVRNLSESVEDTKAYKNNISELSQNLTSLNQVYGNMLAAMNFRPNN